MGESTGTAGYDIFTGHLGHLSTSQAEALVAFKIALTDAKLYDPAHPSPDDPTLLRFLRARGFDPVGALKQYSDYVAWRREHDVDNLFATFDAEELERSRRFYSRWNGRRDKNGMPIVVYRLASLDSAIQKELSAVPRERSYKRIIALYEGLVGFILPLSSFLPHPTKTPITCVTTIVDLQDVSIGGLWSLRGHINECTKLATANYPETLNTIAIVNAPVFFPTIWGWIKGWLDPGTRAKIHVLGKNPAENLLKLIDAKDLPRVYGGTLEWEFFDEPILDDAAKEVIGVMPRGPALFVNGAVVRPGQDNSHTNAL
ncbi:CRAL/TRIO domain-containing protein [Mycena venus]|uniref:CRAL/TRIO domain-containing protein n=1 Tax=Mycena venus TaxID=2733690 RepID=A0A8H6Z3S3_9AGAR|nr:CRAL/TRIO domain-containing protein [Mycena venus]